MDNHKNEPKVSIITPCFNREAYIGETLQCLQHIRYSNWECIVVDDASTDNSAAIIRKFAQNDPRIKYIPQEKSPIPVTKNNAVRHSSGTYLLPLDSDDLIAPAYIAEAVELLENNASVKIVCCEGRYFGAKKNKWKLSDYTFEALLLQNSIPNTAMFRRTDFDKVGGYDPDLFICEDWELWINMLKDGGDVVKIKKEYFFYRKHGESTMKKNKSHYHKAYKLIYEKHKDLYAVLLENPLLLLREHRKYKKRYNTLRRLTFRKPID
ncbi:MAG: glycosyltransferase [Prevotellaceae bacterium]|jgi:glycosyltransferase involved in cell wall biosynthesis|nr:glycosyltransferase [Prevotellaceae bacterium]